MRLPVQGPGTLHYLFLELKYNYTGEQKLDGDPPPTVLRTTLYRRRGGSKFNLFIKLK